MKTTRRDALLAAATIPLAASCATAPAKDVPPANPSRTLGKTGARVEAVSLGGEGVLRSRGRDAEAVSMIRAALEAGVCYCDTAPAYESSQDYYGKAFAAMPGARERIFLASKTHERTRAGALGLLDESLRRLGTSFLDLWQMHDLRSTGDLDAIFGAGGAIEAAEEAKRAGRIRHIGLTGHHDPAILLAAMSRYAFDTVLLPINAADPARNPFMTTVIPEARKQGMGIIGMKVLAHGMLVQNGMSSAAEAIRYAMAHCDTAIIGCANGEEIRGNLIVSRTMAALPESEQRAFEGRLAKDAARYAYYKG